MALRVVVVANDFPGRSETFIRRHVAMLDADLLVRRALPRQRMEMIGKGRVVVLESVADLRERLSAKIVRRLREELLGGVAQLWPKRFATGWQTYVEDAAPQVALAEFGSTGVSFAPWCEAARIPLVVHFHGFDASSALRFRQYREALPEMFRYASAIIVVSRAMASRMLALGCPSEKIFTIPCGTSLAEFTPKQRPREAPCRFASVGRFVPVKGPLLALRAFTDCVEYDPRMHFTMVGDGPLLRKAKTMAAGRGLQHSVTFSGALDHDRVAERLRASDVFVQHSITDRLGSIEGWGVAIAEASACGLPTVSTRHGGIPDQIIDGKTGFLVREGDWRAMAEKMRLLAANPRLRQQMGRAARERVHDVGNVDKQIAKLRAVLESASRGS